jgi:hypothetical protein
MRGYPYSLALLGIALAAKSMAADYKRPKRREWRTKAPNVYPPNPFESRQVRRARERREKEPTS